MALIQSKLIAHNSVKIKITYYGKKGKILAVYDYYLKLPNANNPIEHQKGDNINSQNDIYSLPTPIANNVGRYVLVSSLLSALEVETEYQVLIEVIQDEIVTDSLTANGIVKMDNSTYASNDIIQFI